MAYIPANAKWWLADLIVGFTIEGRSRQDVHYDLTLVRADSPEQAYEKALAFGRRHEATYTNTDGQLVSVRFWGLRELMVIYDDIEDGAELLYEEEADVAEDRILASIKPKEKLSAFESYTPTRP